MSSDEEDGMAPGEPSSPDDKYIPSPARWDIHQSYNSEIANWSTSSEILRNLFFDRKYTDVTVQAGAAKTEFQLHRAIISAKSRYFQAACKDCYVEGKSGVILLGEIEPEVFELVTIWLYGGGYEIPGNAYNRELIKKTYGAADYLQIQELKIGILSMLRNFLEEDLKLARARRAEKHPFDLLHGLCAYSQVTELEEITATCAVIATRRQFTEAQIAEYSKGGPGSSLILAAVVKHFMATRQ